MNTKSKTFTMFGNTSKYLTFDEAFQYPIPEFDPFKQGQKLFIIRKPNFMRRLELNIIEQFRIDSCDRLYRLAKIDPHDVPKVYYDRATGVWTSDDSIGSGWSWFDPSQRKIPPNSSPSLTRYHRVGECPTISSEKCSTSSWEYFADLIRRDMDETYQRLVNRQLNKLLE